MERGIEVAIAVRNTNPGATYGLEWFREAGCDIHEVPFPGYRLSGQNIGRLLRVVPRFTRLLAHLKPDVVHVHAPTLCAIVRRPCRRRRIPVVTTFHLWPDSHWKQRIASWAIRMLPSPVGDRCIAISSQMAEQLHRRLGIAQRDISLVLHGVDDDYFRPPSPQERMRARQALGIHDERMVIVLPAIMRPRKNHALLIDALARLKHRHTFVQAICAGDGPAEYVQRIRARAVEAGVQDRFHVIGHHDSRELYWASDVCILPSLTEGFGLVTVEAMMCGLVPIRTPAEGSQDQIQDGVNGFVVPFHDVDALAAQLGRLHDQPGLRRQLGDCALACARQRFTLNRMIEQTLQVYLDASLTVRTP